MGGLDDASERYLGSLVTTVGQRLGPDLFGTYLHGSAVLGGYDVRRSDLDVLVVTRSPLDPERRRSFARAVSEDVLPCPAIGLELSVVTAESAGRPTASPAFEVHVTTAPEDRKVVDGHRSAGDPDLVLHYAVCRASGRPLGGAPPPTDVFAAVPEELVLAQLGDELVWAGAEAPPHYAVLNACRARRYAADRLLVSKVDGGTWALGLLPPDQRPLVQAALARQRGETVHLDTRQVRTLCADVRAILEVRR